MIKINTSYELRERLQLALNKYSKSIIKLVYTYVKNLQEAEDITQEVFLTYFEKSPVFESEEHEKAYLMRVAINKSKNYLKSGFFRRRIPLIEDLSYMPKEDSQVLEAVLSLDEKYRLPIHLFYYEGYSIKEISDILKEKPSTIATRLDRGRDILKKALGGLYI